MTQNELLTKVLEECTKHYDQGGVGAVCDHVIKEQNNNNPDYYNITYKQCTACDAGQPNLFDTCLVCGSNTSHTEPKLGQILLTVGELRKLMSNLDDNDIVCVEACDEEGDVEDLYPLALDVIEGIELLNGSIVREVRFCQRPHNSK